MDISKVEDHLISIGEPKMHGEMCKSLCSIYAKLLAILPDLEAARPRSTSGIQSLCALHIALEKAKNLLQHCAECSKLYLAITGDSIVLKFEKARCVLEDSLRLVEDIVPQVIGSQIKEILGELQGIVFSLDPTVKQTGDEIIALLRQGRNFNSNGSDNNELDSFHQAASKLCITSSRAALRERRALKKLIERAQAEEDKRKESIIAYLLHLMRKYSKLFRTEFSDDNDLQGSTPCSPTIQGSFNDGGNLARNGITFERQLLKLSSFNFKSNFRRSEQMHVPPEELRCPISLQLMYDPVIIASGQTYERVCIEKWFSDGHNTCPKSEQQLPHLSSTPNYCVKSLVASWCEQNGIPVADGPPQSLDLKILNYWRLALSESDYANSKLLGSVGLCNSKGVKVVPLNDSAIIEEVERNEAEDVSAHEDECKVNPFKQFDDFLTVSGKEDDLRKKCKVVEQIRHLLKDDEEARIYMGANGFVEALLQFLESAVYAMNGMAQETGAMALFNLAVNNNRNKEIMLASGVLPVLQDMITNKDSIGAATALYLSLSCLEEAKPVIGSSDSIPFLIRILEYETGVQCKLDALHALYNLSSHSTNIPILLSAGIIHALQALSIHSSDHAWMEKCIALLINLASSRTARDEIVLAPSLISGLANALDVDEPIQQEQAAACLLLLSGIIHALQALSIHSSDHAWMEKCIALLINLASSRTARDEIVLAPSLISGLANALDVDEPIQQEQAAACLLLLCKGNEKCGQVVLQEGVIPSLVSISVNGTMRGKQKAQKLLMMFREQRQQDPSPVPTQQKPESDEMPLPDQVSKPLSKSISTRKVGKAWSFWWKNKSFSVYQC
ncbi:U-box domain-containing 45-like [Olea europaea subsp. europaea]|uniref:RING-type E3 ubiquitin transferase n=1 Tax=Olea europaea subsp. europaea TaxID=158383 RepID=A0A8S0UHV9_OLEEU|nr:U-box domain-containing 45-like [Olea europaea subsp. europaea]